jgi:hypothetical protein
MAQETHGMVQPAQLSDMPLLKDMPEASKVAVAQAFLDVSEVFDLDDGEALMREGTLAFGTGYVLVAGSAAVERSGKQVSEVSGPVLLGEMSQFKSSDMRVATIFAQGPAVCLQFIWDELYERAESHLSREDYGHLIGAIERLVWGRSDYLPLASIALFKDLSDETKMKVCLIFPWITRRETYSPGQVVFKEGGACNLTGYLLTKGTMRVSRQAGGDKEYGAPNMVGVMPKDEPRQQWTATATAVDEVELFSFSWKTYIGKIRERLSPDEQTKLIESMKHNAQEHFWH